MDQKKEFIFFFFLFLLAFAAYKFYFHHLPSPIDHDRYSLKKVDKKRSLPFAYYFLIVVAGIFLVIIYYLFKKIKVKKQEVVLKDEQAFEGDQNLDGDGIDDILGYEQNVINRNNNPVFCDGKVLDSIVLDSDLVNQVTKLKKGETAVLTDKKIFQKTNDNHLKYFSDREVDFFDRFLLTEDKRRDMQIFLSSEKEFMSCFLMLFLRINNYFFHLQEHNKKKDNFFYFRYFYVKNLRREEEKVQSGISSLWQKTEEAREKTAKVAKDFDIKIGNFDSFFNDMQKDIVFLTTYQDRGFSFDSNYSYKKNRAEFKEKMEKFKNESLYQIYANHLQEQDKIVRSLSAEKIIETNEKEEMRFNFDGEEEFRENAAHKEVTFFDQVQKKMRSITLTKLKEQHKNSL